MATEYILYGADHSLYTGKARAYMRFKDLDWREVTATKEIYKTIILPKIGAPIVPVLETSEGHYVQDTTDIIDFLEARHPAVSVYPDSPVQKLVALLLELYGDEWLVIPAMHYRWSVLDQQRDFILSEFGRMSAPDASHEEQVAIGEKHRACSAALCLPWVSQRRLYRRLNQFISSYWGSWTCILVSMISCWAPVPALEILGLWVRFMRILGVIRYPRP